MSRTGENIYRRKDGRWEGRYIKERVDGKARYGTVYARNYRDVKQKLDEARKEAEKRVQRAIKRGTVADVGRRWLSDITGNLKKSSANKYEDILRCYIYPEFGERDICLITDQQVIGFANRLLKEGGSSKQGLKPATVAEVLSALNGIRMYALKQNYKVAFSPECIRMKQERKEIRVFSLQEEERLIAYIQRNMDLPELGVLLCLFTGIRVGELCALTWDDISLTEKTLRIQRTMQRIRVNAADQRTKVKILEPKSASSVRAIPLPDIVMEYLEQYHTPGVFLLTGHPERYMEPRTIQNRFKKMLVDCGVADANFHATRHTFATRCIELGFDTKSLSEILGHSSVTITMNRYVHPSMKLKTEHMNRFSALFAVGEEAAGEETVGEEIVDGESVGEEINGA